MTTLTVPEETQKALDRCKIALMAKPDTAFFITVAFSLKHIWSNRIPTACTDGRSIWYNPEFFMKWDREQQLGLLLHETLHVVFMHMLRLGSFDPVKWNVACDYVINLIIIDRGFKLPKGALIDEQYRDMTAEQVYHLLPDPDPNEVEIHFEMPGDGASGSGQDDGQDSDGGASGQAKAKDLTKGQADAKEALERELQDILVRAKLQSELAGDKPGTIPGEIELYIKQLLKPKLPTATLLRKFFFDLAKDDYSWKRPNRRFFPEYYLPSLYSEALGHVAFFADLSGSVTDSQVKRYISEVGGVMRQCRPKKLTLGAFDTHVRQVDEIHDLGQLAKMKFTGRGGTDIYPVLEWAKQEHPKALIILTDGHFDLDPGYRPPKSPVIWLINDNKRFKPHFGRVLHYESD